MNFLKTKSDCFLVFIFFVMGLQGIFLNSNLASASSDFEGVIRLTRYAAVKTPGPGTHYKTADQGQLVKVEHCPAFNSPCKVCIALGQASALYRLGDLENMGEDLLKESGRKRDEQEQKSQEIVRVGTSVAAGTVGGAATAGAITIFYGTGAVVGSALAAPVVVIGSAVAGTIYGFTKLFSYVKDKYIHGEELAALGEALSEIGQIPVALKGRNRMILFGPSVPNQENIRGELSRRLNQITPAALTTRL